MTKTKSFLVAVAIATMAFTFSCSSNNDDEGGGGGGGGGDDSDYHLDGSVWTRSNPGGFDYFVEFESKTDVKITIMGMMGNQYITDVYEGTYTYYPNIREGIMYCYPHNGSKIELSSDHNTLTIGGSTYR